MINVKIGAQVNEIYERADEENKAEIKLTFDYEAWKEYFKGFLRRYDREKAQERIRKKGGLSPGDVHRGAQTKE